MRLNEKLGLRFEECIQEIQELGKTFRSYEIIEIISAKYDVTLTKDQVRYYKRPRLSKKERLLKYAKENSLMAKWNGKNATAQDTNYAEALFDLAQGKIKDTDFNAISKGC